MTSATPHKLASCRSCHAPIIFAISPRSARMPLDAKQRRASAADVVAGRSRVIGYELAPGLGELPEATSLGWVRLTEDGGLLVYVSHFATCPNASQHSKRAH